METYKSVMAQIAKLQLKAERLRKVELKGVIERIRDTIHQHGLSVEDLGMTRTDRQADGPARKARPAGKRASKPAAKVGAPKYQDPATGNTWTGRGKPPHWIVGVPDRTAFLIGASSAPAEPEPSKATAKKAKLKSPEPAKPVKAARKAAAPQARKNKTKAPARASSKADAVKARPPAVE